MCLCVCVFTVESVCLQITSHPFNMVLLPTGLLSVWPWEWHVQATNFCFPETHSESQGAPLKMSRMMYSPSHHHNGTCNMYAGLGGRVCVCGVGGVSVFVFTVESGSLQITSHLFNMVLSPSRLLSVWPWEWHVQEANFCFQETHTESQGTPLKTRRMRCSSSPHHNGTSKIHAGLGGRGCVCLCVCVHCGIRLFANHLSSLKHSSVTNRTSECLAVGMARASS